MGFTSIFTQVTDRKDTKFPFNAPVIPNYAQDVGVYLLVYISCRDAEWHPRVYTYSSLDQGSTLHPSPSSDASSFSCYGNELPCSMFLGGFGGYTLSPNLELNRQNAFPRR